MLEEEERPSESGPASPAETSPSTDPARDGAKMTIRAPRVTLERQRTTAFRSLVPTLDNCCAPRVSHRKGTSAVGDAAGANRGFEREG